jgi:hypothetical protein
MDGNEYWYYLNGHLKDHIVPPKDPSSVTYITIRLKDIGYKIVEAEVILSIEGEYIKPSVFYTSLPYEPTRDFKKRVTDYVKKTLIKLRGIDNWTGEEQQYRENNSVKSNKTKRCKCNGRN